MAAKDEQIGGDHYKKRGDMQPIQILKEYLTPDEFRGFVKGSAIYYLLRERDKGGESDIDKAEHILTLRREMKNEPR